MGLAITAVVSVAVVALAVFVVFSQPRPVWTDAAEHSRWFWFGWAAASMAVGVLPALAGWFDDWAAAVWLAACCAFGALQPAMISDIVEVRRDIRRRRASTLAARRRQKAREVARAPDG